MQLVILVVASEILSMPVYDYFCPTNNQQLEVSHSMNLEVSTWAQLCELAKCELGDTPGDTPVRRMLSAPRLMKPTSDTDYKNQGFSKYVKRDEGVYENVTAKDGESRIINREGKPLKD
ncbi:MAG: zinc ribbon domain-containing protein [Oscillatoriales cyanobacterium]|nr:MAG: zinc ribbon domain-containing protein [Oscillatoriales cyanobacterium]TAE26039.1 MAG: zinc ribbon domain-containing protein [Oscillatoriales cyanobacterium]TAE42898.1 MAG: zinc ribbon domain-containing protein [Oscillatoriales cyanobacterium]TAE48477.1 MAG: zinc ribbon domain-containing protein [Oscillatoriales cyanobacterium]TAE70409.1 MAG: zinc ribbon domain-containing protein [Oscillatoriales cyanobacterium]